VFDDVEEVPQREGRGLLGDGRDESDHQSRVARDEEQLARHAEVTQADPHDGRHEECNEQIDYLAGLVVHEVPPRRAL
jgi:hypothetical protein